MSVKSIRKILFLLITTAASAISLVLAYFVIFEYKATEIPEEQCVTMTGFVTEISEGGASDAIFRIEGNQSLFYINRGLDKKFTLADLQKQVLGKKAKFYFSGHNPILMSDIPARHIRKMEVDDQLFYSEY